MSGPTPLERALAVVGMPREAVERVDPHEDGLAVSCVDGERAAYFHVDGETKRALDPFADPALPLTRTGALTQPRFLLCAYRPGKRLTAQDQDDGSFWKALRRKRARRAVERLDALRGGRMMEFSVPTVREWSDETDHLVLEPLPGAPLRYDGADQLGCWALGMTLDAWHRRGIPGDLPVHDVDAELAGLERAAETCARLHRLPGRWTDLRDEVRALATSVPRTRLGPVHRDLHDGQVLWGEAGLALLDFDLLARGDATLDAGNFLAHLRLRTLQGVRGADEGKVAAARGQFAQGFRLGEVEGRIEGVRFHECTTLLRLALVYSLRPRWSDVVPGLLDACRRRLHDPHPLST